MKADIAEPKKRRPSRQSWATRPLPPLTLEELDRHLDLVARLMQEMGRDARLLLPIWRRVKSEREKFLAGQAEIAEAIARLTRSPDRTAAQSS